MDDSFADVAVVAAIAFGAPLVLALAPSFRLPAVVLELVAGVAVGPSALGWVEAEGPVRTLALIGLAFLLLLAGLAAALAVVDVAESPVLIAIMLSATSLGVVIPVLRDLGESDTRFGRWRRLSEALIRLQDTTAQIRVRGAFLLLAVFVVLAERFGIETILGAFVAGATLKLVDRDRAMTHPRFHEKLEAVGFGVFVPFFFVASGVQLDLGALRASGTALALVPLFLAALLVVRGAPVLLYGLDRSRAAAAALLQVPAVAVAALRRSARPPMAERA